MEKHLYYYREDASQTLQWHIDRAARGSTTRHASQNTMLIPLGDLAMRQPIQLRSNVILDGGGHSKLKCHTQDAFVFDGVNAILQGVHVEGADAVLRIPLPILSREE